MQDELQTFLEAPTARNYRRVRELLCDASSEVSSSTEHGNEERVGENQAPTAHDLRELASLSAAGEYEKVLDRVSQMLPEWSLSPRVHFYAANAADHLGETETAEIERFVFQACLEGLLATGNGTMQAPYQITYLSDEYDVLTALGLEPRTQALVDRRGLLCDVVQCTDDEEVWFELAGLLADPRQHEAQFTALQGLRR